jgi:glycosyltransferase involved in cell wall biosynthesis
MLIFQKRVTGSLRRTLNISEGVFLMGYVGGIAKTRELDFIVNAFVKLNNGDYGKWALVFIGDGDDLVRLKDEVSKRSLDNVFFLGRVSHVDVPGLISDLTFGVCHLPSLSLFNTSFPMKVLEYLAAGIPVLVSDIPAHKEIARKIRGVIIYDFTEESFISAALESKNIPKPHPEDLYRYNWNYIANDLIQFYIKLTK